jgi:hypothetical protein
MIKRSLFALLGALVLFSGPTVSFAQQGAAHLDYDDDFAGGSGSLGWKRYVLFFGVLALNFWVCTKSNNLWSLAVLYGSTVLFLIGLDPVLTHYGVLEPSRLKAIREEDVLLGYVYLAIGGFFIFKALKNSESA